MAFDGITVSAIANELNSKLKESRVSKIAQPEKDALQLTIKGCDRKPYKLFISANPSLPLIYFNQDNKPSPLTAPNFCMLLRKHINGARIISVTQIGLERVIKFELEHLNELGDTCIKYLIVELMGKHSNIIFCEPDGNNLKIIDSIKRVNSFISSVREVLPGREYFIPNTMDKYNPYDFSREIMEHIKNKPQPIQKAIYTTLTGFSPIAALELCSRAGIESDIPANSLDNTSILYLYNVIQNFINCIKKSEFKPVIIYDGKKPIEFSVFELTCYADMHAVSCSSASTMLEQFYEQKESASRIHQKSSDLRRIVNTAIDRNRKKLELQNKQYHDTDKRDNYRIYGELLTTYGYSVEKGSKILVCNNYYTNSDISIPLDIDLSPIDNAKKYFEKYNKLKRTYEALTIQIHETTEELDHLESISNSLEIACNEADLNSIKDELITSGYIRKTTGNKKKNQSKTVNEPLHYISNDGFDIYVGKNNYQNDELTFSQQAQGDWWFHSKGIAGSHVVLRSNGREIPDKTFEEAGSLAAYYSKGRSSDKVEIDYTELRNVKKPKGAKPGFVVYYTNYSLVAVTDISCIKLIKD